MTLNLPPDPNDAPRPVAPPTQPPQYRQPPQQPAPPAFPDGSRGAAYREPYVVTRRNNFRVYKVVGAVLVVLLVIVGVIVATLLIVTQSVNP